MIINLNLNRILSSATRARTWDILVTLILKFLTGVDYIIILADVRRFGPCEPTPRRDSL